MSAPLTGFAGGHNKNLPADLTAGCARRFAMTSGNRRERDFHVSLAVFLIRTTNHLLANVDEFNANASNCTA
jgi:hypothetical protein